MTSSFELFERWKLIYTDNCAEVFTSHFLYFPNIPTSFDSWQCKCLETRVCSLAVMI